MTTVSDLSSSSAQLSEGTLTIAAVITSVVDLTVYGLENEIALLKSCTESWDKTSGSVQQFKSQTLPALSMAAHLDWYHAWSRLNKRLDALHHIQSRRRKESKGVKDYTLALSRVSKNWNSFGLLLGCDVEATIKSGMHPSHYRCSWEECPRHLPVSSAKMRRCVGCHQAYYCSTECQRK